LPRLKDPEGVMLGLSPGRRNLNVQKGGPFRASRIGGEVDPGPVCANGTCGFRAFTIGVCGNGINVSSWKDASADEQAFGDALRRARLAQAAHFDALMDIRDAQTLRLAALRDDLAQALKDRTVTQGFVDLALVPGESPRLWVDLVTYVVMEPSPRVYRVIQDRVSGKEVLFESTDRAAVAARILDLVANRLIDRERVLVATPGIKTQPGYSGAALALAWISGFAIGMMALFLGFWVFTALR
jgi:hypothetical protein